MTKPLTEGGNVQIELDGNVHEAGRIDTSSMTKHMDAVAVLRKFFSMLHKQIPEIGRELPHMSGSAEAMFDKQYCTTFSKCKTSVGDIDIQLKEGSEESIEKQLKRLTGKQVGTGTLLGYKKSVGQFITLWSFEQLGNIQIDFEFVEYSGDEPSAFEKFAHGSSFEDLEAGIKGVFSKYLLRACTSLALIPGTVIKVRSQKSGLIPMLSFSPKGLRQKYIRREDLDSTVKDTSYPDAYVEDKETSFLKDMSTIIRLIFGTDYVAGQDLNDVKSFKGQVRLIKRYIKRDKWDIVLTGFERILFGEGSQELYRGDKARSDAEKNVALSYLKQELK